MRGVYALYLLDNPNPQHTMADIFEMFKSVDNNILLT